MFRLDVSSAIRSQLFIIVLVAGALGAVLAGRLFRHGGLSTALWLTPQRGRLLGRRT